MKHVLLACFYLAALCHTVSAQLKIPPGNLSVKINTAEVPPDWKSDRAQPDGKEPGGPLTPIRFVSGRQGDILYQRLEFKNGTAEEVWFFESWLGWRNPKGDLFLLSGSRSLEEGPTPGFFHLRFPPGLEWVKREFSVPAPKGQKEENTDYYATEATPSPNAAPIPSRAWIDSSTGTPISAQRGKLLFTYQFGQPLVIPALPVELAEQAKSRKKVRNFIKTMRSNQVSE